MILNTLGLCSQHAMINLGAHLKRVHDGVNVQSIDLIINIPKDKTWCPQTVENFWKHHPQYMRLKIILDNDQGIPLEKAMFQFVNFLRVCYSMSGGDLVFVSDRLDVD